MLNEVLRTPERMHKASDLFGAGKEKLEFFKGGSLKNYFPILHPINSVHSQC